MSDTLAHLIRDHMEAMTKSERQVARSLGLPAGNIAGKATTDLVPGQGFCGLTGLFLITNGCKKKWKKCRVCVG